MSQPLDQPSQPTGAEDQRPGADAPRRQALSLECARLCAALEAAGEVDADLRGDLQAFLRECRQVFGWQPVNSSNETLTALPAEHPWSEAYAEMLETVRGAPDELAEPIRERLRAFPEAALNRALDVVAIQFYVDYWGELGRVWRERHSGPAGDFAQQLFHFLRQALRLFPFTPHAFQDYPDGWLQRIGGRGMVTGRVRRVIRPGLQDEDNQLRVPALVEVD